jgi:membrane-associated protein
MTLPVEQLLAMAPAVAYTAVAALVFAEAALFVGFVLPGETAVLLGGVLASQRHLSLVVLLVLVVTAAVVGDTVGYEVGKHAGPRVLDSRLLRPHAHGLDRAHDVLRRRGGSAVFLGRFTAFLRAVMPAMAGLSRMPYRRFLPGTPPVASYGEPASFSPGISPVTPTCGSRKTWADSARHRWRSR